MTDYVTGRDEVNLQSILIGSWKGEIGLPPTWDCQLCYTRKHQFVDSLLVKDMMAEYFCFNGLWHKPHRQQNLTDTQNFWNLDQNKKKEQNKAGWKNWKVAKGVALDRKCWPGSMEAYAPTGVMRHNDNDDDDQTSLINNNYHNA